MYALLNLFPVLLIYGKVTPKEEINIRLTELEQEYKAWRRFADSELDIANNSHWHEGIQVVDAIEEYGPDRSTQVERWRHISNIMQLVVELKPQYKILAASCANSALNFRLAKRWAGEFISWTKDYDKRDDQLWILGYIQYIMALLRLGKFSKAKKVHKKAHREGAFVHKLPLQMAYTRTRSGSSRILYNKLPMKNYLEENAELISQQFQKMLEKDYLEYMTQSSGQVLIVGEGRWSQVVLFYDGWKEDQCKLVPQVCKLFQRKFEVTQSIPGLENANTIAFILLQGNMEIMWHSGENDSRIHCSLGISIPNGDVALQVSNEVLQWEVGKAFCFDDSVAHRLWNKTPDPRWVFLVGQWHPFLLQKGEL